MTEANGDTVVYRDEYYTLGLRGGLPYLIAGGRRFTLTCHPYEPCLYITEESGLKTAVHNAFDPFAVLDGFRAGETVTSITGFEYDAKDFCRMAEYASAMGDTAIDGAEKVFGGRSKKKAPLKASENAARSGEGKEPRDADWIRQEADRVIRDDPFYGLIDEYPDRAVEFCLVGRRQGAEGLEAHREALAQASRELFFDGEEKIWNYDCGRGSAEALKIDASSLFAAPKELRAVNFRGAFMYPPQGGPFTEKDFERLIAALFPNGTEGLEVYEWTTDWSDYFDDGHEWWGALCFTVYDKSLDRFVVIMASATD